MKPETRYRFFVRLIRTFSHPMKTVWETPYEDGPCIFVPNHAGALGPVDICAKFEKRQSVAVWCNNGMMERKLVPDYVRQDYWWKPGCRMEPLLTRTLPYMASWLIPPLLNCAPTIPVYHDARVMTTLRRSVKALQEGKQLVVFPEQPSGYRDHHTWINTAWLSIGDLWYRTGGETLRLYPVYIDTKAHAFRVAAPIVYDRNRKAAEQADEIAGLLAKGLRGQ